MIGAIIGDIVGTRSNLKDIDDNSSDLFAEECHITGNTVMMLASAKAIMETDKEIPPSFSKGRSDSEYSQLLRRNVIRYLREFCLKYSKYDYEEDLKKWIHGDSKDCFDNGVILRVIPVGFCAWSDSEAEEMSNAIASGTLNILVEDDDSYDDNEYDLSGFNVDYSISKDIFKLYRGHIKTKIDAFSYYRGFDNKEFLNSRETNHIISNARKAVVYSNSFEEAVLTAVKYGGSIFGAVAGALNEAYFGISQDHEEKVLSYLDNDLRLVLEEWISFSKSVSTKSRFKVLTKHIPTISARRSFEDMFAEIRYDNKEHSLYLPIHIDSYRRYEMKYDIIPLIETYPEYELNEYSHILRKNGIECSWSGIINIDYDTLDAQCILAILMFITSSERFIDGKLLDFFNGGHLLRTLKRLSNIDHAKVPPVEEICLSYGGFHGGYKDYHIVINDTGKLTIKNSYAFYGDVAIEKEYSVEEINSIVNAFNKIHVEYWDNNYCNLGIMDGVQWSLAVKYKGSQKIKFSGNNAFPKNFGSLAKIFDINYGTDDEFEVDRLVFSLERSFVMNDMGELKKSSGRVIETLIMDRNKNMVTYNSTVNSEKVSHSYNINIGIANILAYAGDCIRAEGWKDTLKLDAVEGSSYFTLNAELNTGDDVSHYGVYDANSIPEESWTLFMKSVRDYLKRFVTQDIMDEQTFDRTPRNGKVRYCNVKFDDVARPYYYRTEDGKIKKGDRVSVPFGKEERVGTVIKASNYDLDKVPFSMEKTRGIISKIKV